MIDAFEKAGYNHTNLAGIPFDWRISTYQVMEQQGYLQSIKQLVEKFYAANNNMKVHMVTHSMGGVTAAYFLNQQTPEWKDKYIASFIPISGPFQGAPKSLRSALSGDTFGIELAGLDIISRAKVAKVARQSGGVSELFPSPAHWPSSDVLVTTPSRTYTVKDYTDLFKALGSPITNSVLDKTVNFLGDLQAPGVEVHCLYGTGIKTEMSYTYSTDDFSSQPTIHYSDEGDGTVPLASLQECKTWEHSQSPPVNIVEYHLRDHQKILTDADVIDYILQVTTHEE